MGVRNSRDGRRESRLRPERCSTSKRGVPWCVRTVAACLCHLTRGLVFPHTRSVSPDCATHFAWREPPSPQPVPQQDKTLKKLRVSDFSVKCSLRWQRSAKYKLDVCLLRKSVNSAARRKGTSSTFRKQGPARGTAPPALGGPRSLTEHCQPPPSHTGHQHARHLESRPEPSASLPPHWASPCPPAFPGHQSPSRGAVWLHSRQRHATPMSRAGARCAPCRQAGWSPQPRGGQAPAPWVPASGSGRRGRARGLWPTSLTKSQPAGPVISSRDTVPGSPTVLLLLFLKIKGVLIGNEGREWG